MKEQLAAKIGEALARSAAKWGTEAPVPDVQLTIPKHADHGDYATNVAMMFAKTVGKNPREIATALVDELGDAGGLVRRADIAGPGFINLFVNTASVFEVVRRVEAEGSSFGRTTAGAGKRVLVEFVSANPTGPLHIGHGRGAVVGDALASLLDASGFAVEREYYVNDAGLQIQTLGRSTVLRYRQLIDGKSGPLEQGLYQGDYMIDHARALRAER
ncbi:MAG: arginine--tRNA ligase, partial [Deltaproteobacteria bacterium]|nr:arginine--tRNA ligase [Deltaproteobacteria bacterium]